MKKAAIVVLLFLGIVWSVHLGAAALPEIPQQDLQRIEQAMPDHPVVQPKKSRKLLVFDLSKGYKHASIPYADRALQIMGKKTGAFTVVFSSDLTIFSRRKLRKFDAICFNNTTHLDITKKSQRKSLLRFVRNGGGIIGIHAASDNFYTWPEGSKMLGGLFDEHPWTANGTWAVRVEDPNSPLTKMFNVQGFKINDEIYRIKYLYDQSPGDSPPEAGRESLHLLLTLDMNDDSTRTADGVRPSDTDPAVSWIRTYGDGRVFYSSFGHNPPLFWNPMILQHYLAGIQYALGDLDADATPSLDIMLRKIAGYDYGMSRKPLTTFNDFLRSLPDSSLVRTRVEERLLETLQSATTFVGKQYICEKLSVLGTARSVPPLTRLLADNQTADIARYALERIPGRTVDEALRQSLDSAEGKVKVGIINTIGRRKDEAAVPQLVPLVQDEDEMTAEAAISALGHIANPEAREALHSALSSTAGALHQRTANAYLDCARQRYKQGENQQAAAMYREVYELDEPVPLRTAALTGMIRSAGANADQQILAILRGGNPAMQSVAIRLAGTLPHLNNVDQIAATLDQLPARQQAQLLYALGQRGDTTARPVVMQAVENIAQTVRIAALKALATVGDASSVELLARVAGENRGVESEVARQSLYRLPGTDVNETIVQKISTADPMAKVALIQSLKQRHIPNIAHIVLQAASDPDSVVRATAIGVLGTTAGPKELPAVIDLLVHEQTILGRTKLQNAILEITEQIPNRDDRAGILLDRLSHTSATQPRVALLETLGAIGDSHALPVLRSSLRSSNAEIKRAATLALSSWPDATPAPDLLRQAQTASSFNERVLALRGYIQLAGIKGQDSSDDGVAMYQRAMGLVARVDEQHLILAGLAHLPSLSALRMAADYLNDSALEAEAGAAALAIAKSLRNQHPEEVKTYLTKIEQSRAPQNVKDEARQLAENLQ